MTEQEFNEASEDGELDYEYAEYIEEHCHGDRIICNGHTLVQAMEDLYLWDSFKESMIDKPTEQEAHIMSLHDITLEDARSYIADMEASYKDYQEMRDGTK